jgi:peptide deformylase
VRKIVTTPNKVLSQEGRRIDIPREVDFVRDLRRDMSKILRQKGALGLTACQVGVPVSFFIVNKLKLKGVKKFNYFINPCIEQLGTPLEDEEGCLSIPGKLYLVSRYNKIRVRSMMLNGTTRESVFSGLTARVIQHEFDHTKGVLVSDIGTLIERI